MKPNYTALTHQVVHEASEPQPFAEIMQRVHAIAPITTKNPKGTIRNAVTQSRLIVATGDGRYGWLPRLINGSVVRLTLSESDVAGSAIEIGDEARDLLWPTFYEVQSRRDVTPIHLQLPDRTTTLIGLGHGLGAQWHMTGSPEFGRWFSTLSPSSGDHLILGALDGEQKLYTIEFQPRTARDEAAIAARNQAVVQAALAYLKRSKWGAAIWEIVAHLLATGQYRHPVPPDPLTEIWTEDVWGPVLDEKDASPGAWYLVSAAQDDLFGILDEEGADATYDYDNPQDLPREYHPDFGRRPRQSAQGRKGPVETFVLRVNRRDLPKVWRDIEIAADQSLEDLHLIIQAAFDWDDDHLYSFFMNGRAWSRHTEIGSPWSDSRRHTHQVTLGSLDLKVGSKFLYLFDYGDQHEFDIKVMSINPAAPKGKYPRVVAEQGAAPQQYSDVEDEDDGLDAFLFPDDDHADESLRNMKHAGRQRLHGIWQAAQAGEKLQGEGAQLAQIMREHTEWHAIWNRLNKIPEEDLTQAGVNPVLHLVVHQVVVDQIDGALPQVKEVYEGLLDGGSDRHDAIHQIGAVFMEEFGRAWQADQPFDETRYVIRLKQLITGKPRPLHRDPRSRRR